jgi:hypothetical protein
MTFIPGPKVIRVSGALLYFRLHALLTNIKLGWKGLRGTNTLAYYEQL